MSAPVWFQNPAGTRDFYPAELNRRRYLQEAWRRVAVLHGFEEIDGPAFEHADLYVSNSGSTLSAHAFTFRQRGGEMTFALRPEFTPTLARMFAERAGTLARPTRWFSTSNCFRSEKAASGRLREFWQWNADIIGDGSPRADAEIIACCATLLDRVGLKPADVRIKISHRAAVARILTGAGVLEDRLSQAFDLLDLRGKVAESQITRQAADLGLDLHAFDLLAAAARSNFQERRFGDLLAGVSAESIGALGGVTGADLYQLADLAAQLDAAGILPWCDLELGVVRGLAYYTGMVFEAQEADGPRRTIGGGGRYDNLIAAFGGAATPAVGFGMADAPLLACLKDRGLLPTDQALASILGAQPDAIVGGDDHFQNDATTLLAALRNAGVLARRAASAPSTATEARESGSRFAVTITEPAFATLVDLATGETRRIPLDTVLPLIAAEKQRPIAPPKARTISATTN